MKVGIMKYLIFVLLLIVVLITAGCVGGNQNAGVTPTQATTQSSLVATPSPTTELGTPTPTDSFVIPTNPRDVSEQNFNRVLMECKDVNNVGGQYWGYSKTPVCVKAYDLYVSINKHVPSNPYEVSASKMNEQEACAQGRLTDLEYCAKIGVTFDQNGNYRINISKMNY